MRKLRLRPLNSQKRNTYREFSLQCTKLKWKRGRACVPLRLFTVKDVEKNKYAIITADSLLQIKTFWAQLSWPDVESSYAYISKILDVSRILNKHNLNIH
jgi:hypothetical protein